MWNSFLWGKQNPSEGVACRRQPQSVSLYKPLCSVVRWSESHTAHCHQSEKNIEKSCSNSFSGLIFQVLRTQRSSVSITLSVFKQKEQKVALQRWVSLGLTQPAIHPAWTRVQKCPADPDRCHFVNSPHCDGQKRFSQKERRRADLQKDASIFLSFCSRT